MKILFLQKRLLFPTDTGGKIRTLNILRYLAQWHDVTYLCNLRDDERPYVKDMEDLGLTLEAIPWDEAPRGSLRFYRDLALNLFSRYPYNVNKDFDTRIRQRAKELLEQQDFDLVICDFVQMARNILGLTKVPTVLFEHNVEAQIFQRHAQTDEGWLRRKYMWLQWKKMQWFEGMAGHQFDAVVAVSPQDREKYEADYGWQHAHVIDTAVDIDYFHPQPEVSEQAGRLVFVGSLDWLPNEDGLIHFVRDIWPRIHQQCPHATFDVVGRNPPESIQSLGKVDGVRIVGTVPDTRPHLAESEVVVVPLRIGGGTRLKIFEAMAMQKPIVSTPLGAEGLEVNDGEDIVLAEGDDFADSVVHLLQDAESRKQMAERARQLVVERYSAERIAQQFNEICLRAVNGADYQSSEVLSSTP